jgi:cytoskeleton protein RodZ
MNNSESEKNNKNQDFGSILAEARKAQNYSISDVNSHLKIPEHIISAIESNDIDALPEPAFTHGYIRSYARFLEIPEQDVLDVYNRAVPHNLVAELKTTKSTDKDNQLAAMNLVTVGFAVLVLAAILYGGYHYYSEKADVMENELETKEQSFTGSSLDSPTVKPVKIEQNAELTENDGLIVQSSGPDEVATSPVDEVSKGSEAATEISQAQENDINEDILEITAENGAWVEVRDANDERLFYNMIPEGGTRVLSGKAPFYVVLGNAGTTKVLVNDLEIDMSAYTRSNNTAKFRVSSKDNQVVFH